MVDSQPVVIAATRGRILRHRPRIDRWALEALVEFDAALISEPQLRQIVDSAGSRVGVLDFRPACKGSYGRFEVKHWGDSVSLELNTPTAAE